MNQKGGFLQQNESSYDDSCYPQKLVSLELVENASDVSRLNDTTAKHESKPPAQRGFKERENIL
jgi:hypothetical protein